MKLPLRLEIDPASDTPVIRQLIDSLRVLLVEGELRPGVALPPVRRVAMELGIHFNTVAEAYRQLASEGWLELRHGRPALVVERKIAPLESSAWTGEFRARLRGIVAQMRSQGVPAKSIAAELLAMSKAVNRA